MSVKRKQAEREAVAVEGDDSDDPERVENDRMASVLAGRGKLWTTLFVFSIDQFRSRVYTF